MEQRMVKRENLQARIHFLGQIHLFGDARRIEGTPFVHDQYGLGKVQASNADIGQ